MVIICHDCSAQRGERLPDSVGINDTVGVIEEAHSDITTVNTDTVGQAKENIEDSVILRRIPDSVIAAYKKDKNFLYANDDSYWIQKPVQRKKNFFDYLVEFITKPFFRWLLYILFGAVILFALYRLIVENKLHMFYSPPKKKITEAAEETDITYEEVESKIQEAIASGDFRSAIRYLYLKALKKSGDKGFITLNAQATNHEYINQFAGHPGEKEFRILTNVYEYVWYGGFVLTPVQFESLRIQFNHFYSTIDH
jgi:hypothetical protein